MLVILDLIQIPFDSTAMRLWPRQPPPSSSSYSVSSTLLVSCSWPRRILLCALHSSQCHQFHPGTLQTRVAKVPGVVFVIFGAIFRGIYPIGWTFIYPTHRTNSGGYQRVSDDYSSFCTDLASSFVVCFVEETVGEYIWASVLDYV